MMFSFELDIWGYGQSDRTDWLRKEAESAKDGVVEIRTDLQAALDRTRGNIVTFGKLQSSKGNDPQRLSLTSVLKNNIDKLLFELDEIRWFMSVLNIIIDDLLLELDITYAMRTELDRSKSELDALEKDRNAMQYALKQTRRDISAVAEGRETMQELLAQKEMAIAASAKLQKDKEALQDAIYLRKNTKDALEKDRNAMQYALKQTRRDIWLKFLQVSTFPCRSIISDLLLLRRKEKAFAILENYIAVLQFEIRRRTDMSGWSARYVVTADYMQTYAWVNHRSAMQVELDRTRQLQDEKEMKIRVNKIHVTFGGKPTTSKDVQRYKTSVSFKGMSTEVLERQNYEKQSEDKEEEEEEFRAVEQMLMCKVCLDDDLSIVFLPCRHMATCERCASVLYCCPVCRSPINESLKVNYE